MSHLYQDFEPDYQYRTGEVQDIIEFHVKDFKKEQLSVHQHRNGTITVSGERPEGTRWIRFRKEFKPPKDVKANEIRARLSSDVLFVTIPKKEQPQAPPPDPVAPVQRAPSPAQEKGKLEQGVSSSQSKEAADTVAAKQSDARDAMTSPTENATLPKASPKPSPKPFISRLKMERKTAMKVAATVAVLALMFTMLFYGFKFYAPMIMHS